MPAIESSTSPESANLIFKFLETQHSGVLATADATSIPHAAVIYFSTDEDLCLRFATKNKTKKYENLEQNANVALACYDEATQTSLQVMGHVEKIESPDETQHVVNGMHQLSATISKTELPPAEKVYAGDYVAFKIVPEVIKMAVYSRPDSQGDDIFETLIFSK